MTVGSAFFIGLIGLIGLIAVMVIIASKDWSCFSLTMELGEFIKAELSAERPDDEYRQR